MNIPNGIYPSPLKYTSKFLAARRQEIKAKKLPEAHSFSQKVTSFDSSHKRSE